MLSFTAVSSLSVPAWMKSGIARQVHICLSCFVLLSCNCVHFAGLPLAAQRPRLAQCKRGYLMDVKHEACVIDATECRREPPKGSPGCTYKCPLNSCIKPGRSCVDSFEDCGCIHGYTADHSSHRCVIDIGSSKWARSRIGMAGVEAPATTNEVRTIALGMRRAAK